MSSFGDGADLEDIRSFLNDSPTPKETEGDTVVSSSPAKQRPPSYEIDESVIDAMFGGGGGNKKTAPKLPSSGGLFDDDNTGLFGDKMATGVDKSKMMTKKSSWANNGSIFGESEGSGLFNNKSSSSFGRSFDMEDPNGGSSLSLPGTGSNDTLVPLNINVRQLERENEWLEAKTAEMERLSRERDELVQVYRKAVIHAGKMKHSASSAGNEGRSRSSKAALHSKQLLKAKLLEFQEGRKKGGRKESSFTKAGSIVVRDHSNLFGLAPQESDSSRNVQQLLNSPESMSLAESMNSFGAEDLLGGSSSLMKLKNHLVTTEDPRNASEISFFKKGSDGSMSDEMVSVTIDSALPPAMTYPEFLSKFQRPDSRNLLTATQQFLKTVLGPLGNGLPPTDTDKVEYEFMGPMNLPERVGSFVTAVEEAMERQVPWSEGTEEERQSARDGVETYIMTKVVQLAFKVSREDLVKDAEMNKRIRMLQWLEARHLDVNPYISNEMVTQAASNELQKINHFAAPMDKMACIVKCCSMLFKVLESSCQESGNSGVGADDFVPGFIYVVLKANVPNLHSNCEYIQNYRNPNDLRGQSGYCLVSLRSAMEFILSADATHLTIEEDEYNRHMHDAKERESARNLAAQMS